MVANFYICLFCLLFLVWFSRSIRFTLALPLAYFFALLLQHIPGVVVHLLNPEFFIDSELTELGLRIFTWGTVCFVIGVVAAQLLLCRKVLIEPPTGDLRLLDSSFIKFCLLGGWFVVYGINPFVRIPSIGAAIDHGSSIWIVGILLGLTAAAAKGKFGATVLWVLALFVYPFSVLIQAGFLSFGSTSVFVVCAALLVKTRSKFSSYIGLVIFSLMSFFVFVSYFQVREELRKAVWGGAGLEERIDQTTRIVTEFGWFDPQNPIHLRALDIRLNQNKFIGMAVDNLNNGRVEYLRGRSVTEAVQALIPRALWPNKPVFAGNSRLIREVSLKEVNETTTFGAGLIMELYVNFGMPSLIIGSLLFGFIFGGVDKVAAIKIARRDYAGVFPWFLVGVAMNAPLGLISRMASDVISSVIAGYGWRFLWGFYTAKISAKRLRPSPAKKAPEITTERNLLDEGTKTS